MKILLTLFVLYFSSSVVAEDISDFEIDGMSIGDSLLDYFSEKEITNADTTIYPKSKSYYSINLPSKKDSKYESYVFAVKANQSINPRVRHQCGHVVTFRVATWVASCRVPRT